MADRRRNRTNRPPGGARGVGASRADPATDEETRKALALFNAHLAAEAEEQRQTRRIEKATRVKERAAEHVRSLEADTRATAEQRAAAAAAYRDALAALERARRGEPEPAADQEAPAEPAAPDEPADAPFDDGDHDATGTAAPADH